MSPVPYGYIGKAGSLLQPAFGQPQENIVLCQPITGLKMFDRQNFRHSSFLKKIMKTAWLLIVHVDDVLSAGDENFEVIMEKLREKYTFGKVESKIFVFTGLNIRQSDNMEVSVDQNDFINKINAGDYSQTSSEMRLNSDENKVLRSSQGQLSWISFPFLSFIPQNID